MSNQNINISPKNIAGKCDLKCSYNFKYSESNSTAKNNGVMINLTYDSTSVPPVIYNNEKYTVANISIVSPSIHLFNGANKPGEIIITHNPVKGGNILEVCIPFTSSIESSTSSQLITDIISKVASNAPSDGDSTNLNMTSFNLQNIVPKKPFFSYLNGTTDYIVFGDLDSIPLSSSTITTLQQIIQPFPINTPGGDLFYNSKGPSSGISIGDGIYISCQPTGSSTEQTAVEYNKTPLSSTVDLSNLMNNQTFKIIMSIIIGCLLFIIIFYGLNQFYKYLSSEPLVLINK
jgi:hypothetical protein